MNEEMNNEMMEMDNIPAEEGVSSGNYWTTAVAGVLGAAIGAGAILLAHKRKAKKDTDDEPKEKKIRKFWKRKEKESEPDIVIVDDSDVQ